MGHPRTGALVATATAGPDRPQEAMLAVATRGKGGEATCGDVSWGRTGGERERTYACRKILFSGPAFPAQAGLQRPAARCRRCHGAPPALPRRCGRLARWGWGGCRVRPALGTHCVCALRMTPHIYARARAEILVKVRPCMF